MRRFNCLLTSDHLGARDCTSGSVTIFWEKSVSAQLDTDIRCCFCSVTVPSNISTNDSEKLEDPDQRIRDMPQGQTHDKTFDTLY